MAVIFLTGRAESQRPFTEQQLRNAGFLQWDQLILRAPGQTAPAAVFKAAERRKLMEQGYTIVVNVGDQYSDLEGGYADSIFKLPNPMYHVP
jgi:predicted secreted acid phosphatase